MLTSAEIAAIAAKALDDKKARDIKVLKTDKQTVLASSPRRVSRPYAVRVCAPIYGC